MSTIKLVDQARANTLRPLVFLGPIIQLYLLAAQPSNVLMEVR